MKQLVKKGTTSLILDLFIENQQSPGNGLTGLVYNTSGLTAYYKRRGSATWTAITLATMTLGTYASGGLKESDATNAPGVYEFCPPDAAIATGASSVTFYLKGATNMVPVVFELQLTDWDPNTAQPTNFALLAIDGSGHVELDATSRQAILAEPIDNAESSATAKSLAWLVALALNQSSLSAGTVTVKKTDNTTTFFTQTVTQTAGVNPITSKNEAS